MGDLHFLYALKVITVISKSLIFFHFTHANTQIPLSGYGCFFFIASAHFQYIFFPIKPIQGEYLSDYWKHTVAQLILYSNCYFSEEHLKIS